MIGWWFDFAGFKGMDEINIGAFDTEDDSPERIAATGSGHEIGRAHV